MPPMLNPKKPIFTPPKLVLSISKGLPRGFEPGYRRKQVGNLHCASPLCLAGRRKAICCAGSKAFFTRDVPNPKIGFVVVQTVAEIVNVQTPEKSAEMITTEPFSYSVMDTMHEDLKTTRLVLCRKNLCVYLGFYLRNPKPYMTPLSSYKPSF